MTPSRTTLVSLVAMSLAYASAVHVGTRASLSWKFQPQEKALPTPEVAKVASLGFRDVLADLYFVDALQYFGYPWNHKDHYQYLSPLIELVSELDPRFREPLLWGAISVQENLGNETWIHTAESTRFLHKGVERFPEDYRFYLFLAYNQATFHHQYRAAAETLKRSLHLPGRPHYLPALIARLYSAAGDLDTATAFADALLKETQEPRAREVMKERMLDIQTERLLRQLDDAAKTYRERTGEPLKAPLQLVVSGILTTLPLEPRGGFWYLDEATGEMRSNKMPGRLRITQITQPGRPKKPEETP